MLARFARLAGCAAIAAALLVTPAEAAKRKEAAPTNTAPKPVFQYIGVVLLLAGPLFLVCRSSRR